jgi:hypothetical protein
MLVWGGFSGSQQQTIYSDGAAYDPTAKTWSMLPAAPIAGREYATSVWTGRSLFIWGGFTNASTGTPATDGALYTPSDHSWTKLPPSPITGYQQSLALVSGQTVIVLTTPRGNNADVVHADSYNPATNKWSRLPDLKLPTGHTIINMATLANGDQIYLWSMWSNPVTNGSETIGYFGIDGFTLNAETRQWSANALAPQAVRNVAQPLWTGRLILIPASQPFCGGCSGPIVLNRAGIALNPRDATTSVIPHGPVDDLDPTYLWTGAALLAVNTTSLLGTSLPGEAAVWNPVTSIWTRLPDAPAGSSQDPVTVWTGSSLLMWGVFAHYDGGSAQSAAQTTGLQLG